VLLNGKLMMADRDWERVLILVSIKTDNGDGSGLQSFLLRSLSLS
jgi:hypothetical protein